METHEQTTTNELELAKYIMVHSTFSVKDADSSQEPFFQFNPDKQANYDKMCMEKDPEHYRLVDTISKENNWTPLLKYIYVLLGASDREFTYRGFIFLSLHKIQERQKIYQDAGQSQICDLAIKYHGMGWVHVLSLDQKSGSYFVRMDGGSSDWDRDANWKFFKNYSPSSRPETLIHQNEIFNHLDTELDFEKETDFSTPNKSRIIFA